MEKHSVQSGQFRNHLLISGDQFEELCDEIREANLASMQMVAFVGMIVSAVLFFLSLPFVGLLSLWPAYSVLTIVFVVLFVLSRTVVVAYPVTIMPCYYLMMVIAFSLSIIMGTIWGKTTNATTFLLFTLLIPWLMIDRPWHIDLFLMVSCFVFCLCALRFKSGPILSLDLSNSIVVCLLAMVFYTIIIKNRLQSFAMLKREKEQVFEKDILINAIPTGIGIFEVHNGVLKQTYINDAFFRLVEDTRQNRLSDDFLTNIHPMDRQKVCDVINEIVRKGKDYVSVTCRARKGDGRYKWIRFSSSVAKREEQYILIYSTYVSMEEEVQSQEALQHSLEILAQTKLATQAKTDFLSRMSHDIRTPLNAILGTAALAADETNDPQAMKKYLETIDSSGHFLLGLVNDILDISKIESGRIELRPEVCLVREFESSIEAAIRPLMECKHIDFQFRMECGYETIVVDRLRHHQIFFNLLSNAAKYTPEYGKVEYITQRIPAPEGKAGVRNIVRDNGIGMTKEYMQHLFEPFTRDTNAAINQTEGSGLGLAIVKNIVEAMGGTIQVNSELGRGTEFIVELFMPIAAQDALSDRREEQIDEESLRNRQILVVEDNKINCQIACKLLEKKGCIVTTAQNGQEAVELLSAQPQQNFDLILMDIRMPVMNGLDAAKAIRQMKRSDAQTIPIIAMTADAFSEDISRTREAGMNGHLPKPVEPMRLYQMLTHYLNTPQQKR